MATLIQEKVHQSINILNELDIDAWLIFVRETLTTPDPVLPLIFGSDLTWQSALILTRNNHRTAIVGRFEEDTVKRTGAYDEIITYDESIRSPLLNMLKRLEPKTIAINYSRNDPTADGLSFGMYQILTSYLKNTRFLKSLLSAENLIGSLKGRKTPEELQRIKKAIITTEEIYQTTFDFLKPGFSEVQIADFMHQQLSMRSVRPAWNLSHCPTINAGPHSPVGHVGPTDIKVKRGHLVHFDFGVKVDEYCSDIQRVVYMLAPGESSPPDEVKNGFELIVHTVHETVKSIKPGMLGFEVDHIARSIVTDAGFPEYKYSTGHHLGREAHDGGGLLGPLWERYGESPRRVVETGHVYTIEPGITIPEYGYIGLEENILVTDNGAVFLSKPQTELIIK